MLNLNLENDIKKLESTINEREEKIQVLSSREQTSYNEKLNDLRERCTHAKIDLFNSNKKLKKYGKITFGLVLATIVSGLTFYAFGLGFASLIPVALFGGVSAYYGNSTLKIRHENDYLSDKFDMQNEEYLNTKFEESVKLKGLKVAQANDKKNLKKLNEILNSKKYNKAVQKHNIKQQKIENKLVKKENADKTK